MLVTSPQPSPLPSPLPSGHTTQRTVAAAATEETLHVAPWPDMVLDATGHDPRSAYVERFWLGILGPSTTWLLRSLAYGFDSEPDGFELPLVATSRSLGLGNPHGQHSVFRRSLNRLDQFDLARRCPDGTLLARRTVPWIGRRQLSLLPPALHQEHRQWESTDAGAGATVERARRRANHVARTLVEAGQDLSDVEAGLLRWQFPADIVEGAASWAWQRHYGVLPERDGPDPTEHDGTAPRATTTTTTTTTTPATTSAARTA
jgi:hypothetical protein